MWCPFHCGHSLGRRLNRRGKKGEDGGGEWLILAAGHAAVVALGFCGATAQHQPIAGLERNPARGLGTHLRCF